jgi:hypothetical protein
MALNKLNHKFNFDFLKSVLDLKNYVFINLRKQTRQKMESISAC